MRILISTDIHSNILAAEEADRKAAELGADLHVNLGDSLDIGPWPEETLQFLRSRNVVMVKGNHEEYHCSDGFGPVIDKRMGEDERSHYEWTTSQLSADSIDFLENMPYGHSYREGPHHFRFQHFPLKNGRVCEPWIETDEPGLSEAFGAGKGEIWFFGHIHRYVDAGADPRFICPGATGISQYAEDGRIVMTLTVEGERYRLERHRLEWDLDRVKKEVIRVNRSNRNWLLDHMYKG